MGLIPKIYLLSFLGYSFLGLNQSLELPISREKIEKLIGSSPESAKEKVLRRLEEKEFNPEYFKQDESSLNQLTITSDRQTYETSVNRFVAEGNVVLNYKGTLLKADKIEFDTKYKIIHARRKVRIINKNSYLQASTFRYNLIQGEGELKDVYGLINLKNKKQKNNQKYYSNKTSDKYSKSIEFKDFTLPLNAIILPGNSNWEKFSKKFKGSGDFDDSFLCPPLVIRFKDRLKNTKDNFARVTMPPPLGCNEKKKNSTEIDYPKRVNDIKLIDRLSLELSTGTPRTSNRNETNSRINKITSNRIITGSISKWRFQAKKLRVDPEGWYSDKVIFTNDPFTPTQTRIEAKDVEVRSENNGDILISTSSNNLIIENKSSIPIIRRRRLKKEDIDSKWLMAFDGRDRDGLYIGYKLDDLKIGEEFTLSLQPQFMIQRAAIGKSNSFVDIGESVLSPKVSSDVDYSDLFGFNTSILWQKYGWEVYLNSEINSLNLDRFDNSIRSWGSISRGFYMPIINDFEFRIFGAHRYRVWNGSLGEREIYSAKGIYIIKNGGYNLGRLRNSYLFRFGSGLYEAESREILKMKKTSRNILFGSINSNFRVLNFGKNKNSKEYLKNTPNFISPGLDINSQIKGSLSLYGNNTSQKIASFSIGPSLTLGRLKKPFLDYTNFSFSYGISIKDGNSPFKFDQAVDLKTLAIRLKQQIFGPLLISGGLDFNVDKDSEYYGNLTSSRFELLWQRRSYDISLYFKPDDGVGGINFRLNDFSYSGNGLPFLPYEETFNIDD